MNTCKLYRDLWRTKTRMILTLTLILHLERVEEGAEVDLEAENKDYWSSKNKNFKYANHLKAIVIRYLLI